MRAGGGALASGTPRTLAQRSSVLLDGRRCGNRGVQRIQVRGSGKTAATERSAPRAPAHRNESEEPRPGWEGRARAGGGRRGGGLSSVHAAPCERAVALQSALPVLQTRRRDGWRGTISCEYLQDAGLETRGGQPVEMRCEPRSRIPGPDRAVTSAKGRAPGRPSAVRPRVRSQRRDAESYLYRRTPGGGACAGCGKDALGVDGSQVSPTDATPNHRLGTRLPPGVLGAPTGGHSHGRCT